MSTTFPKGNRTSGSTVYRRFTKRSRPYAVHKEVHVDDEASTINSLWLDHFIAALNNTQAPIPNRKAPTRSPDVPSATLAPAKNGWDFLVAVDKGSTSNPDFVVKSEWRRTGKVWNALGGTSMASPAVSGMAGLLFQKLVSSGILIEDEDAAKQSESFKKLRKILVKSAVGYEQVWFRRKLRIPEQDVLPDETHIETASLNWIQNSEEILRRLESPDTKATDQITAVLFAETTAFSAEEKPRMLNALFTFANGNRFSTDEKTVVAVGSAVRKFAMNMPASMLDQYAQLFVPSATESISCRIELELAKGASWRLAKFRTTECASAKQLECRLAELASDYLVPRLILQKNYASIALAATVGAILMNGESQEALLKRVHALRAGQHEMNWFRELLADRLMEIAGKQGAIDRTRADRLRVMARELDGSVHC